MLTREEVVEFHARCPGVDISAVMDAFTAHNGSLPLSLESAWHHVGECKRCGPYYESRRAAHATAAKGSSGAEKLNVEVGSGPYGEDSASIRVTDDVASVSLTDLSYQDVQNLALMLKRHVPYATLNVAI